MKTTNNLRYSVTKQNAEGNTVIINIRLNDECGNGHNDFAITGEEYEKGKPMTDRNCIRAGAMGDDIALWFPEFKIFNDLHLCDAKGAPMYAQGNGFYHLKNSTKEVIMSYLRITAEEFDKLAIAEDQLIFTYLLESLKIPARWEAEALQAIAELEKLTGFKFEDDSKRGQFTPLTLDEVTLVGQRINEGYYKPENIELRCLQAIQDKKLSEYKKLVEERNNIVRKADNEFNVKATILLFGLPIDNLIYYEHTNSATFNWKEWDKKITKAQFDDFVARVDYKCMPNGITFKFGEK